MKSLRALFLLLALLAIAACGDRVEYDQAETQSATPSEHPASEHPTSASTAAPSDVWSGDIIETMNSGGYSYVLFEKDGQEVWVAGPETAGLQVGAAISMSPGMMMKNFHAKSLDRDFDVIYFVSSLAPAGSAASGSEHPGAGMGAANGAAPQMGSNSSPSAHTVLDKAGVHGVEKAAGGYTVAEIHEQAATLGGQRIKVRGQVVKFTPNIMRTNWIHLQDGSGEGENADLTITTNGTVAVGDVITLEGPLSVNKDFGAGYRYSVIIEGAQVVTE